MQITKNAFIKYMTSKFDYAYTFLLHWHKFT